MDKTTTELKMSDIHMISFALVVVSLCQRTNCQCDNSPTFVLHNSVVTETELCSTKVDELSHVCSLTE